MNCKKIENDFLTYLRGLLEHSPKFYSLISKKFEIQKLDKREVVFNEGEVSREAFWLQSGYGRYFQTLTDENGTVYEETKEFCRPGKVVFGEGFFDGSPSQFSFELAAGAVIIPFNADCYDALNEKVPEVAMIANKIQALNHLEVINSKNMMKMNALERYREFLEFFGIEILQAVAVKDVASNLGLKAYNLSRIRGEYHKKKTGKKKCL